MHPILLEIGPLTIYSYGTMVALAFLSVIMLCSKKAKKETINPQIILDLSLLILISSIIGARIAYVIKNFFYYKENLFEIIMVNRGGLFFFGGFITAFLTSLIYLKFKKITFWKTADIFALYLPLGQAIGRVGCLLNGCCFGKQSHLPWGIVLPGHLTSLHPVQIYSSLSGILLFIILSFIDKKKKFDGQLALSYLFLYSLFRFVIEFVRGDHGLFAFSLTGSQLVCLALFVFALFITIFKLQNNRQTKTC